MYFHIAGHALGVVARLQVRHERLRRDRVVDLLPAIWRLHQLCSQHSQLYDVIRLLRKLGVARLEVGKRYKAVPDRSCARARRAAL